MNTESRKQDPALAERVNALLNRWFLRGPQAGGELLKAFLRDAEALHRARMLKAQAGVETR